MFAEPLFCSSFANSLFRLSFLSVRDVKLT